MTVGDQRLSELEPVSFRLAREGEPLAPIERLPKWLLCIPIGAQVVWLGLKYRSMTLPTVLNGGIENGGLVGESKFSYFENVGDDFKRFIAQTVLLAPGEDPETARRAAGLAFPLIAKPDIGWCGYGVRRIDNVEALNAYAANFPASEPFLLQQFVESPNEAGVHYIRGPQEKHGRIVALTIRHPPCVVGDGEKTVTELIKASPRTAPKFAFYRDLLRADALAAIPGRGERVVLTTVASVRVGGRYEDATHLVSPALSKIVDGLCRSMGEFHYGRLDVRFESIDRLRQGEFKIIEINGAGSEAIQYWDTKLSLVAAFSGVFAKQRELYALAHEIRKTGKRPSGWRVILRAHFKQQRLIRVYPASN